jgi:MFS transporter, putative metabolite:H+ symporter
MNSGAGVMVSIVAAAIFIVILDVALLTPKTTGKSLGTWDNSNQFTMKNGTEEAPHL